MGDAAFVVEVPDASAARALARTVRERKWPGVRDVVGGIRSVLVMMEEPVEEPDTLMLELGEIELGRQRSVDGSGRRGEPATVVEIPTVFDGPDLDEVASTVGIDATELVAELTTADLVVAAVGFSPGFAYLSGLPEVFRRVPRRPVPRPSVPAGSVAVAGGLAAVYPRESPGGWQIVGQTGRRLFDPTTPPFAVLAPGDHVRFVARPSSIRAGWELAVRDARSPLAPPPGTPPGVVVEEPGMLTTVQDGGRPGYAHLGVPESGSADRLSHCLANRLVGNPPTAAALEVTLRGPEVRFHRAAYVAAVGGGVVLELDGWPVDAERVVAVAAGQRLRLVTTRSGARAYLAVAGSFRVAETMGSCATDTLSGIGPPPLRSGDQLGIGPGPVRPADHLVPERQGSVRRPLDGQPYTLRVLVGPDNGWFSSELGPQLGAARFTVDSSSNRVGIRLVSVGGNGGIERRGGEIDSQGMVTGAVQVLPTGNPVVLLPDHATLGGYPVAAVVISADRHLLGQCRPGDEVRFEPVDAAQAVAAHRALRSVSKQAIVGRYPVLPG